MISAVDNIFSPNRFELLNCETTENDENDHPYHKDTSIVGSDKCSRQYILSKPNCETTENDKNDHPYHKDTSIVGCDKCSR